MKKITKPIIALALSFVLAFPNLTTTFTNPLPETDILVNTGRVSLVSHDSVTINGNAFDSMEPVIEYGVDVDVVPSFENCIRVFSTDTASDYSVTLDSLSEETEYYYRAYLETSSDYYYGAIRSFITTPDLSALDECQLFGKFVEESYYLASLFKQVGITADFFECLTDEFESSSIAVDTFYELQDYTDAFFLEHNLAVVPSRTIYGERLAYCSYIALVNKLRDSNAKSIGEEIVYMYISHCIDMPTHALMNPISLNSNDGYFSAWITNTDRNVYDVYLSRQPISRLSEIAEPLNTLFMAVDSLPLDSAQIYGSINVFQNAERILERIQMMPLSNVKLGNDLVYDAITSLLNGSSLTRTLAFIENELLIKNYTDEQRQFIKGIIISLVTAVISTSFRASPMLITLEMTENLTLNSQYISMLTSGMMLDMTGEPFFDYVNLISLLTTTSTRAASRYMRYLGW